ncbi:SUR7/PalI family-domain-containing protein [Chaetomium strumarium]|uniref:SUR7/PalI family-domain-containing protein n=1 Tax=Chaetomium strumarium TaxID=1170767 RepID=A0AAJ0H4M8_9PEZI|nr:SUR7/PalI family-domain-containing protein [Chaetomium strumarium]
MLRPATPLSVLLFAAFALLLLSVLSTPIIKVIPLGSWQGVDFGVFGYCTSNGCTSIEIGYDVRPLNSNDFDLPSSTRSTLSSLLIVHPVAAVITLIMFCLAVVAHFRSPSHSSRYLLLLFIVGILDFLVCLLSFLVDVLLFVPHLAWGSYVVLAATILVALSGLVSCAMRRTIVGRKARKKRIAENAEMSGENYYNRQAQQTTTPAAAASTLRPTVPMISGANGGADTLPEFASFEKKDDRSSDERIPLTATRSPSERTPGTFATEGTATYVNDGNGSMDMAPLRSLTNTPGSRDQYANTLPPQDSYPMRPPSVERVGSPGRGGMAPAGYRGRGGYPGPGRGGYNGYGPPPGGRGGYGPPGRGGYGPPGGRGGYGPPPRGYGGPMRGGRTPPPPSYQGSPAPYDRRPSPAGPYGPGPYGARQASPGPPAAPAYMNPSISNGSSNSGYQPYNPNQDDLPRAESPPPLPGVDDSVPAPHAVEMDATTSSPTRGSGGLGQFNIRDSDSDVAGMLALQQGRTSAVGRHMSDTSRYSADESTYVPPRQAWNQGPGRNSPRVASPLNTAGRPAELPTHGSPPPQSPVAPAGEYYEDVDPRFAEPPAQRPTPAPINTTNSYEDIPQGSRSPAESERSNFTSISQRGINPRWNPNPSSVPMMPRRPVNRSDMLLDSNPDFGLPNRGGPSRPGGPRIPDGAYPRGT